MGALEGGEVADRLMARASSCPWDTAQLGSGWELQLLLERKAQAVDELALATLGYLVLPIKSPGLKNETNSLPCPCPRVFYVSELCLFCCQITFAPLALKSCWRNDAPPPQRPYSNTGCVKHVDGAGTEGDWIHRGGEMGLEG